MSRALPLAAAVLLMLSGCQKSTTAGAPPQQIHIAGSSAAFPFSTVAAERLMREDASVLAPLVRADGSGAAIARFCERPNPTRPDVAILTRGMTPAEAAKCTANGRQPRLSTPIGLTALVLVTAHGGTALPLSRVALYRALTSSSLRNWADADPRLPATPIRIEGPAADPAIADGLFELILGPGCALALGRPCGTIGVRSDGAYRGHGADAEMVARTVASTPGSVGIIPYAQAVRHHDTLDILPLDGTSPTPVTIADGRYPSSARLLLIAGAPVPGLARLLGYYADAMGPGGIFVLSGFVPLPKGAQEDAVRQLASYKGVDKSG